MATQYLNTEKLENKKKILEAHKVNIMDYLTQIKDEYMNMIKKDSWWGPRSDKFFESLKSYWYDFSAPEDTQCSNRGIIGNIETDFNNMINFIQNAIDLSLGKDVDAAKEIESINDETLNSDSKTGVAGATVRVENDDSTSTTTSNPTPKDTENKSSEPKKEETTNGSVPTVSPSNSGASRNVSVGGFYPSENNNENTYVAGLNYKIIDESGNPARDNIGKETIKISGKDYQVYTYDDPETPEKEHYIIGALLEDGKNSRPTGKVYTIDYGNGDVYEFVDLDTNAKTRTSNERTPGAAMDTYVDILSVKGKAYNNVGIESREPVKIGDTGKTVSKK